MVINDIDLHLLTYQFFQKHRRLQGRSYSWIADQMGYCYDHTTRLLTGKRPLTEKHKQVLIELLEITIVSKDSESSTII